MASIPVKKKISAFPTKGFFITTIVKDIDLIDAIFDLIDNAIDGHIKNNISEKKLISISVSEKEFKIEDNCGGIKKDDVYDHVFRFGKSGDEKFKTIGIYGIGLKRAIFKIGKNILIESDDGVDYYSIRIDEKWLNEEDNWDLNFENEGKTKGELMTRITITDIYPDIAEELNLTTFANKLTDRIKNTYSIFIEERVEISVNGDQVEHYDFEFLDDGEKFAPFHKRYKIDKIDFEIFAGYTPGGRDDWPSGWYVFCNDRLIIREDISERTGWGSGINDKTFHYPEDKRFLGLAFFSANDPWLLPWKTTKDDIQVDNRIYRAAQVEMRAVTSRLVDVIRLAGKTTNPITGETVGKALFEDIATKPRSEIIEEQDEKVPAIKGDLIYDSLTSVPESTNIQYSKKTSLVQKVKKQLGDAYISNKKAGEKTFEYYVKMEEIEDE